ncbi:uncharacterized protein [Rutidosis leptorrhynchoides]|uniref:uncharacterized protein n=1 Tax=Rutidosis leptorrhynchoides TaxID=125765 RepID=UPI003A9A3240
MAKKKSNTQSENNNNKSINDAASEKLDSLKSLNAMLLKETVERRQQVDSLTSINESLESALKLCKSDNASLQIDMNLLNERAVKLDIEKGLASKVYADQVSEMKDKIDGLERDMSRILEVKNEKELEIGRLNDRLSLLEGEISEEKFILSRVCEERDEIRAQIDDRIRCENELRFKLAEVEKRETVSLEKLRKIKGDYDDLVKGKMDIERKMEAVVGEKGLIEKRLNVSNGLIEKLRRNIDEIAKENVNIEDERKLQQDNFIDKEMIQRGLQHE